MQTLPSLYPQSAPKVATLPVAAPSPRQALAACRLPKCLKAPAALALALGLACATPSADAVSGGPRTVIPTGWYVGGRSGVGFGNGLTTDESLSPLIHLATDNNPTQAIKASRNPGYDFGLTLGYTPKAQEGLWWLGSSIRFEVEGSYKRSDFSPKAFTWQFEDWDVIVGQNIISDFRLNLTRCHQSFASVMGNVFFDVPLTHRIAFYCGAGLGWTRSYLKAEMEGLYEEKNAFLVGRMYINYNQVSVVKMNGYSNLFAWQTMLGLSFVPADNVVLSLGYRFFATRKPMYQANADYSQGRSGSIDLYNGRQLNGVPPLDPNPVPDKRATIGFRPTHIGVFEISIRFLV